MINCFRTALFRRLLLAATLVPTFSGCDNTYCMPRPSDGICKSPNDPSLRYDLEDLPAPLCEYTFDDAPEDAGECCYLLTSDTSRVCDGRPLRLEDRLVVAPAALGQLGWQEAETTPDVRALSSAARATLAQHWTRAALTEHASIASFARASLELMAVGAPAALIDAAHAAARDEVRHARLCFALASAYEGTAIAPGSLPLGESITLDQDLAAIARATVRDGCVNETLAALIGAARLSRAEDPAVRAVLEVIVEDEARHAELAWQTVRWAVDMGGQVVREAVREALVAAMRDAERVLRGEAEADGGLEAHGLLSADEVRQVVLDGLAKVVRPCGQMLLRTMPRTGLAVRAEV